MNDKTSRWTIPLLCLSAALLMTAAEAFARGGRGGGSRGGGGYSRSPSMSRPAPRPSTPSRPTVSRPTTPSRPSVSSPSAGTRPSAGARPSTGSRPAAGARPSQGQLEGFLDLKPSAGGQPSSGKVGASVAAGAAGGAAAQFLQQNPRPAQTPAAGSGGRPELGAGSGRPGVGDRPAAGERASRPTTTHRPDRVENRQELRDQRVQRRDQVRDQVRENRPRFDFWADHPNWARWRLNRPYRWATWSLVTGWFPWGWSDATSYSYGDNVYYEGDSVYYGDEAVATTEEYAQQAQTIATSGSGVPEETQEADWLPLGVFAITQDAEASGPPPTLYLQLQVNKEGIITGTFQNLGTNDVQQIEGVVDKQTQRSAWTIAGKSWPVMETGISNLTQDEAAALVHFEDGQTQQWLLVRMEDPEGGSQ